MATRNRTPLFRKSRDALRRARPPSAASASSSSKGSVLEMANVSLLHPNQSYTPLSTEDPGNHRVQIRVDEILVNSSGLCKLENVLRIEGFDGNSGY